jgi:hypothetical protein
MPNGMISSVCCCSVDPLVCEAWEICKLEGQSTCNVTPTAQPVIPGYVSIGRPLGPTLFDGPFWVGWHNSVTSTRNAKVQLQLSITAYRRVIVQDDTSPPGCTTCPALPPIPDAKLNCTPSAVSAIAGCGRTEYIDNFSYELNGTFDLIGGAKNQVICGYGEFDEDPGAPPGPWPFVLTDVNRTGLTPNDAWQGGDNPIWWPAENRRIVPRFFGQATVTSTAVPSMEFPQVAPCGTIQHINRCTNVTVQSLRSVCVDAPITVVPGHTTTFTQSDIDRCTYAGGCQGCGFPFVGSGDPAGSGVQASELQPRNGGSQAAWGVDVYELGLRDLMNTMFPTNHPYIGSLDEVWTAQTDHDRTRFLYGMLTRLSADQVLRFPDGQQKVEIHDVDFQVRGHSVAMHIELRMTPVDWCVHSEDCAGLCVHSWCENGPGAIGITFFTNGKLGQGFCGADFKPAGGIALGLEGYQMPACALITSCGASATTNCMQYPVHTTCIGRTCGLYADDYVGAKPVERHHLGWKRYRNKYNNSCCLNGGCISPGDVPCAARGFQIASGGELWLDDPSGCYGPDTNSQACVDPDGDGVVDCDVDYAGHPWPSDCPGGYGNPTAGFCCGGCPPGSIVFYPPPCQRVSIDPNFLGYYVTLEPSACPNYFQCGGCNFEINPDFTNGASPSINYCNCACISSSMGSYQLWVDWDVTWSCGPIGTWPLYFGTTCYTGPITPDMVAGKAVVS